jgi:sulfur-oxidizing protein SoxX
MPGSPPSPAKLSGKVALLAVALVLFAALPGWAEMAGDALPQPLTGRPGDAARGRRIVVDRRVGLCLLCHSGPFPEIPLQGDLAPDLSGVGSRWSEGQLRLRLVDPARVKGGTIMPSYGRRRGLRRVAPAFTGRPILTNQEIEDVVAFLATLR